MSNVKQVKVDNWGIYFLQRLKHFFNRTDFCDLTLQFQDNAQLKVHRLVLSACTEYFELLERTCEMYEDCLVMPDDLQADVVVPIVNFMYTGQLEFRMDLLEKLYQTSQIMHMPVLTKLLEAHRNTTIRPTQSYSVKPGQCYTGKRRKIDSTPSSSNKRSCNKPFDNSTAHLEKKSYLPARHREESFGESSFSHVEFPFSTSQFNKDPRPTRYELPEELDTDNVFDNSFCSISYTSKPLMVHPETVKRYSAKHGLYEDASSSKRFSEATSTMNIVDCKKINNDNIFEDTNLDHSAIEESNTFQSTYLTMKDSTPKDPNQLFDQILDQNNDTTKVTFDTKNNKGKPSLEHAKIISEVLKKYSHVLKGNKNIKLKILNTQKKAVKQRQKSQMDIEEKSSSKDIHEYTYETDVIDSKQAAKLIALGAENIKGPWICLICGTPGRALHFPTYYRFRRHLVEVHKEKPIVNICEYCGHKALKRNYLLHHLFSKHDIKPPPQYNFPKCNLCNYIAISESLLVKHKLTHTTLGFRCNVCASQFSTSRLLLLHIQTTGHKYSADRKNNLQCIYCLKIFLRENNLFTHLKTYHKVEAKSDGIIEDSDEDIRSREEHEIKYKNNSKAEIKFESCQNDYEEVDVQYQIQPDGNIHVISSKKQKNPPLKQKILNSGFNENTSLLNSKTIEETKNIDSDYHPHHANISSLNVEEIVTIDNNEYIVKNNQLIPRKTKQTDNDEYIVPEIMETNQNSQVAVTTTSIEYTTVHSTNIIGNIQPSNMIVTKSGDLNQPIQFVVSNEEEYKALMASNNPIIFDSGDDNKTLTVLTTPHGTPLDTATINLNNAQANDMMIIQEEFPLSVADNVSTDNSNIVVVYSHPVDSQNKQYQLLTTQGLEAQFVPSSAIIAQNYETVTTTAPVVDAHVISTQEVWQTGVDQTMANQELQITTATEIQTVNKPEMQIIANENLTETALSELPEVHLLPEPQSTINTSQTTEINVNLNKFTEIPVSSEDAHSQLENSTLSMETDTLTTKSLPNETNNMELDKNSGNDEIMNPGVHDTIQVVDMVGDNRLVVNQIETDVTNILPEISESEKVSEQTPPSTSCLSPTYTQETEATAESPIENINEPNQNSGKTLDNGTIHEIENLTLEWSEDDCETQDLVSQTEENVNNKINDDSLSLENPKPVEESNQKIPYAPVNQTNKVVDVVDIVKQVKNALQHKDASDLAASNINQIATNTNSPEKDTCPPEKISSLLNDWDDNDYEETLTEPATQNVITPIVEHSTEMPISAVDKPEEENSIPKPLDNIKKLVSDWSDDDDEESEKKE